MTPLVRPVWRTLSISPRSFAAGIVAAAALLGLYLGVIRLAQGVEHALEQLGADAPFAALIAAGFGTQIALYSELRAVDRHHRAAAALTAAGTGTSAAAMLACCAHHLVDLLPLVGLSAASVFLNAYRTPLFLIGIGLNVVGVVVIGRQLLRAQQARALVDHSPSLVGLAAR